MDAGVANAPHTATTNGGGAASQNGSAGDLSQVVQALHAIYDAASTNDTRRQATEYLEQAKRRPDAASLGHTLARDQTKPAQLRHYGLTVLEHAIKYNWEDFLPSQGEALRKCVVDLAQNITDNDPLYLRNKVAQLWVEVAKRSWAAEWMDMDQQLLQLWQSSLHHRAVALFVLETLAEEVFTREDATAGLRGGDLARACVEIFTPAAVLAEHFPARDKSLGVRSGDEGWLKRLCDNLAWCLSQDYESDEHVRLCAVKTMNTLRASMSWVIPKAIAAVQVVQHMSKALGVPAVKLQLASVDVLQSIYNRPHLDDSDFVELVCPMYTPDSVSLLRGVYEWTLSDLNVHDLNDDLKDDKYKLCKKLAELANNLGLFIEQKPEHIPLESDLPGVFGLLFDILRNPSLCVSIPVLHAWTKLLRSRVVRDSSVVTGMVGGLLETCCARLLRYEAFPEDSEDVTLLFLIVDIDTVPERHAFLGNYRRFCVEVIEILIRKTPVEAMEHILAQATTMFQNLYNGQPAFQPQTFSKHSQPVLHVDAQVTVIDAALKGYMKWLSNHDSDPQEKEHKRSIMEDSFEQWCRQLLQARFEDPEIAKKVLQLMSTFSTKALADRPGFALTFLEHMLTIRLADNPAFTQYSDAVKDLERICSLEMQKLAMKFPNDFMNVYDSLEHKINEMMTEPNIDERQRMAFSAFLFIIVHRCTTLDRASQEARLKHMFKPVKDAWLNEEFGKSVSDFQSFCGGLGMERLPDFLSANKFRGVQDWSEQPLDSDGQAMQASILDRSQHLPLRLTKTLLAASIEKLHDGSTAYETAAKLWADAIPVILPNLLQLVSYAQAFNNIEGSWSHLPPDLQYVIRRVLTDRFWQAGISSESRDDFFARVSSSKSTYEGFASTVRGTVRQIRESSYYILFSLTRFRDFFYGISDLPAPLSQALFGHAHALSAHHLSVLLSISTHLIENCPPIHRPQFLPPMIQGLFRELNRKINSEWDEVNRRTAGSGQNDNLADEMKTESILRQLTYSSSTFVARLLDATYEYARQDDPSRQEEPPMCEFVLSATEVLEPIFVFCDSTIRTRDTRSVVLVARQLRLLLPLFKDNAPIRDFFCNHILKSAILSLHDPYFIDCQKDLATLIAGIIHLDEQVPRSILLGLPGMGDASRVDRRLEKLKHANDRGDERQQRSLVLDMLSSVRGMSIHEQGQIERAKPKKKTAFQEQYMSVDQPPTIVRGTSPELAGVQDMFGDA
ncbi:armadillo-type protein [Massariosphaeria phaeospora]|uniref:Armadillo-type protein n=1 Tax=Massariosphaeria phaeospora TaxID=100035 RepID=A0A7C8I276_9PLEO|nr:armadillo-type protein [Massariosphaeria phaeospora]